jgi:hypothetical protein
VSVSTAEKRKTVCDICGKTVTVSRMKAHRGSRQCQWTLEAKIIGSLEANTRPESLAAALESSGMIFIPPLHQGNLDYWKKTLAGFPVQYSDQEHGVDYVLYADRTPNMYAQINGNIVKQIIARQYALARSALGISSKVP